MASCPVVKQYNYCSYAKPPYCQISCNGCKGKRAILDKDAAESTATGAPTVATPSVAAEVVLFDQGLQCVANKGVPSAYYKSMQARARGLDDFVVPAGKTWHISAISVMGSWFGDSHLTKTTRFSIAIFNRNKIVCRADVLVDTFTTETEGVATRLNFNSPCVVVGGFLDNDKELLEDDETYYVTVGPRLDFSDGGNSWHWSFSKTTNGEHFKFRDQQGILQTGAKCHTWTDAKECGLNLEGTSDLCFAFHGISSATTEADKEFLDLPALPVKDGDIGTDVGHGRLLTSDEAYKRKNASNKFAAATAAVLADPAPETIASVHGGTPAHVIGLAVVGSVAAVILIIVVAIMLRPNKSLTERV